MAKEMTENTELRAQDVQEVYRANEGNMLQGLLAAAAYREQEQSHVQIEIARGGKVFFTFRIRPLTEEAYNKCREKNTKYVRNKALGIRMPEDTNTTRYRSQLIYEATVPEDREALWNSTDAWSALNVLSGVDLIDRVLLSGEKDAVLEKIDQISGYESVAAMESTAKNS